MPFRVQQKVCVEQQASHLLMLRQKPLVLCTCSGGERQSALHLDFTICDCDRSASNKLRFKGRTWYQTTLFTRSFNEDSKLLKCKSSIDWKLFRIRFLVSCECLPFVSIVCFFIIWISIIFWFFFIACFCCICRYPQ